MFINRLGQPLNVGDFIYYQAKWGAPTIRLIVEICHENRAQSAAKTIEFADRIVYDYEARTYRDPEPVMRKSYIHYLGNAIYTDTLPPIMSEGLRNMALAERYRILAQLNGQ